MLVSWWLLTVNSGKYSWNGHTEMHQESTALDSVLCFNFGKDYCGKTKRPSSWYQYVVACRGTSTSWKLAAVPPYRHRQILEKIEKHRKKKKITTFKQSERFSIHKCPIYSPPPNSGYHFSISNWHSALLAVCCYLIHTAFSLQVNIIWLGSD